MNGLPLIEVLAQYETATAKENQMNATATTLQAKAIAANDARLDGIIDRAEWLVRIAAIDAEITAAGLTWDAIQ